MKRIPLVRLGLPTLGFLVTAGFSNVAHAVMSGELYTSTSYPYGRVEARLRFAEGDGVISSFFLWKDGSEVTGTFWNELDFEKVGADCHIETNAIYGTPPVNTPKKHTVVDPCGSFHTYAYEWTPDAIVWLIDGVEVRRETDAVATAFAQNAPGMQVRFNVWPGDATFGGNFSPSILPVHQYVDWVQFSAYKEGAFNLEWRVDFDSAALPTGWLTGNWGSPKNLSTHDPRNVNVVDGHMVISLTADDATGPAGASPTGAPVGGSTATGGAPTGTGGTTASGGSPAAAAPPKKGGGCSVSPAGSGSSNALFGAAGAGLAGLAMALRRRARPSSRTA